MTRTTEIIEYKSAAKARAALIRMYGNPEIEKIDLVGDNKVLHVTFHDEPFDEETTTPPPVEEPQNSPASSLETEVPEETSVSADAGDPDQVPTPAEAGETPSEEPTTESADVPPEDDFIGAVEEEKAVVYSDFKDLDRKGLVAFAAEKGLDIKIPNNTPLVKEISKVADALGIEEENA